LTATPDTYREVLDQVCGDVVVAEAPGVDADGAFPTRSIAALRDAGLLGAVSAHEVGGLALGASGAAAIVERLAMECGSTAMVACMHFCGTAVLEALGPEPVRRQAATGEHLSTLAFSEVGSRSQFWAPLGTATRRGDDAILNASKSWITSASQASAYVWSSLPLEAEGASTLWLVPAKTAGLSVPAAFDGLGLRRTHGPRRPVPDVAPRDVVRRHAGTAAPRPRGPEGLAARSCRRLSPPEGGDRIVWHD
jgi:alkylation response protein AidB-like acyl-CoA dehydrogenase